jgi:hypothetical protein
MSLQTWQETLINSQADGPALANSVAELSAVIDRLDAFLEDEEDAALMLLAA